MGDEEVALQFAADVEQAVASVRELADSATGLADAAKGAADGVAGIAEPAAAAGDAVKGVADSSELATEALVAYSDEQKSAAAAAGDLALAQAGVKTAAAEVKSAVADLAAVQATAGKGSDEYAAQLDAVAAAMQKQATAAEQLKGVQEQQATAAAQAKTAAEESATATEATAAATTEAATATAAAGTAQEGAATKSEVAAASLGKYKLALVGVGVGAAVAVDAAGKFQDSTTHLVTDAGESASSLAQVQQGILSVSSATGQSASSITDAMYHIESSGFHASSGLAILKTTAEGARVGGADLDTTSKALVGTLTAYYGTSMTAAQATQRSTSLMNQLIATVGSGDMRMQDLAASIHSVAPVAAAAGISFAQVGGAIATMTAQGMSADQVTQDLGHVIGSLSNPTNVMAVEMKAMGLNANTVAKNLGKTGLSGTIDELRDAVLKNTQGGNVMLDMLRGMSPAAQDLANKILAGKISTGDLTKAMKELNPQQYTLVSHFKSAAVAATGMQQTYTAAMSKMLGGQMGLNVGLMLTGTHMKDVSAATANIAAEGAKASSQVDNWSTIQGTFAFKMDQAKTSIKDAGIALGSALLPAVTAVLGPLAHFLAMVAGNKTESIALAVVVGGILAGALGLKLAKSLKDASEGIKAVGDGAEWLIGKLFATSAATEAQAGATEALTAAKAESVGATEAATAAQTELDVAMDANPIGLIIIAIAALIAIVVLVVTHLHFFAHAFDEVRHAVATAGHDVASVFDQIRHDIAASVGAVISWLKANWKLILAILLDPIGTAVMEIRTHWHDIENTFDEARHNVAAVVSGLVNDIEHNFDTFRHDVAALVEWFPHQVAASFDTARHDAAAAADGIVHDVASSWDTFRHDTAAVVDAVVSFFQQLPGKVIAQLAALPSEMLTIGENVIKGLINGIVNAAAAIPSIMGQLASDVAAYFTDPLKLFSPSRLFFEHGFNIVQGAINGVKANAPQLLAAMRDLGTGVGAQGIGSSAVAGAIAPAGGSTSVHVNIPVTATGTAGDVFQSPQYQQALQAAVQEVTLRYAQLNPDNGLTPAWGHS